MTLHRNLTKIELANYKKTLKLTNVQKEILVGTLLGDASMTLSKNRPIYNVKFEQGEKHASYIDHLYEIFSPFAGAPPFWRWIDSEKTRRSYSFRTYTHDEFKFYWHLFYKVTSDPVTNKLIKVKILPHNIQDRLTERVLAYWFMDDGSYIRNKNLTHNYVFNTQNFTYNEVQSLVKIFDLKFGLKASIHKDKNRWKLYIRAQSSEKFRSMISPFLHSNFFDKIETLTLNNSNS